LEQVGDKKFRIHFEAIEGVVECVGYFAFGCFFCHLDGGYWGMDPIGVEFVIAHDGGGFDLAKTVDASFVGNSAHLVFRQ